MDTDHRRLTRSSKAIIFFYGLVLLCIGLASRTLTRHEVLAAYPAKEMLHGNHWIVQMFAGIPRTAKPATTGWFIAATMFLTHSDAEWVPRLPSVLAGIVTALLIASFAARFFGNRVGLLTGLIQLTCFYTIMQARLAEADMLACAAVTAAFVCFGIVVLGDEHGRGARATGLSIAFYFFAGMGFLLKAVPVVFIGLGVLAYALCRRERRVWRFFWSPIGIPLFVFLLVAWPVAAYLSYPPILQSWRFELLGTATGALGYDPIYTYLLSVPAVLMPWTPVMAIGAYFWLKGVSLRRPLAQFLMCWFLPGLIFLHFSASKHKHYPMPMLPPLSIMGAVGLIWLLKLLKTPKLTPPIVTLFTIILLIVAITDGYIIPTRFDDYRYSKDLALAANQLVPRDDIIAILDPSPKVEPHIAYYLRPPIRRYATESNFINYAKGQTQPIYVIATLHQLAQLHPIAHVELLAQAKAPRKRENADELIALARISPLP